MHQPASSVKSRLLTLLPHVLEVHFESLQAKQAKRQGVHLDAN